MRAVKLSFLTVLMVSGIAMAEPVTSHQGGSAPTGNGRPATAQTAGDASQAIIDGISKCASRPGTASDSSSASASRSRSSSPSISSGIPLYQ